MTRRLLVAGVLALLVVTAGCSTDGASTPTPADGQTSVSVSVANTGNTSYTAEVLLIPSRLTQITVEYADGTTQPITNLSSVRGVYAFAWRDVAAVRLPPGVDAESSRRYQLTPGSQAETRLSATVTDATLLFVIRRGDRIAAWATVYCGQENTLDRVEVRASAGNPGRFNAINLTCAQR